MRQRSVCSSKCAFITLLNTDAGNRHVLTPEAEVYVLEGMFILPMLCRCT